MKPALAALGALAALALACGVGAPGPTPTLTPDRTAEARGTSLAATEQEADRLATEARATVEAEALEATSEAATQAARETQSAERLATRTAATAQAIAAATDQAAPLADRVQKLFNEGHLGQTEGIYHQLLDFDQSWAQINWYQYWDTGISPTDFILKADLSWETASEKPNPSGCGVVFRVQDVDNHYLAYVGMHGGATLGRMLKGNWGFLRSGAYGKASIPSGEAELLLIVEGRKITVYVNGLRVFTHLDAAFPEGGLGLTLLSGTNKGFGTRCRMTGIEVWELR